MRFENNRENVNLSHTLVKKKEYENEIYSYKTFI